MTLQGSTFYDGSSVPRAFPVELRERAVPAPDGRRLLRAFILLKVGEATLKRWPRRSREAGPLDPSPTGGDRRAGTRTDKAPALAVEVTPDRILREICDWLLTAWGSSALQRRCLPRLAACWAPSPSQGLVATGRSSEHAQARRAEYVAAVGELSLERLVFLDESGCQRGLRRGHASRAPAEPRYGRRGVGSITTRDRVAAMFGEGATATEVFTAFLDHVLLPELRASDVPVMDSLGAHLRMVVRRRLADAGVGLLVLAPYSPDLDPPRCFGQSSRCTLDPSHPSRWGTCTRPFASGGRASRPRMPVPASDAATSRAVGRVCVAMWLAFGLNLHATNCHTQRSPSRVLNGPRGSVTRAQVPNFRGG